MRVFAIKHFRSIIYSCASAMILINLLAFTGGAYKAGLPILLQCLVIVSVYFNKSWSIFVIKFWSIILIMIGIFMWLAVILDGPSHFGSVMDGVVNSLTSLAGVYFFRYAKAGLGFSKTDEMGQV